MDLGNSTSLQFFGFGGNDLLGGPLFVPALLGSKTFSFLGVVFDSSVVSRVRIITGNVALAAGNMDQNGATRDVVAMDDFLYGEPVRAAAVPIPATLWLVTGALPLLGWWRRRRS